MLFTAERSKDRAAFSQRVREHIQEVRIDSGAFKRLRCVQGSTVTSISLIIVGRRVRGQISPRKSSEGFVCLYRVPH